MAIATLLDVNNNVILKKESGLLWYDKTWKLKKPAPKYFIMQTTDNDCYDYTDCGSIEEAIKKVVSEFEFDAELSDFESAEDEAASGLEEFDLEELLDFLAGDFHIGEIYTNWVEEIMNFTQKLCAGLV